MPMENQANKNPFIKENPSITQPTASSPVMQAFTSSKQCVSGMKVFFVLLVVAALGVGTGYGASVFAAQTGTSVLPQALNPNAPAKGKTYGSGDASTFKDITEGVLKTGGIAGEGQYHLVRPGGDSQNVYLTSSTVDLSQFVGQKIKVWGQTQTAQKAGWLMDVGKVEVE